MDKISVIVPVYNVEKYLKRCIDSILNQTYKNLEIILIDDGSTDNSLEICEIYKKKDERIILIHKKNSGLGLTRNVGMENSTGKYIMFVDSDDYLDTNMIENLYNDLIKNKADTCIGGFKRVFDKSTDVYENKYAGRIFEGHDTTNIVLAKMLGKNSQIDDHIEMSAWKTLFSKNIIEENNIKFPSEREFISEDIIFNTEYFPNAQRVYMSSNIGYNYCDNSNSLTTKYNPNRFVLQKKLFEELKLRTIKLGIYDEVKQRMYNTLVSIARYSIKLEQKYSTNNGLKKAKNNIQNICNDPLLRFVLGDYSVKENKKSKLINYMMYRRMYSLLWLTMKLKNKFNI